MKKPTKQSAYTFAVMCKELERISCEIEDFENKERYKKYISLKKQKRILKSKIQQYSNTFGYEFN